MKLRLHLLMALRTTSSRFLARSRRWWLVYVATAGLSRSRASRAGWVQSAPLVHSPRCLLGQTIRLRGPQLKKKRAFEDEGIAMLGNTETIEQTFQGVLGQEKPKILFALARQVQQSLFEQMLASWSALCSRDGLQVRLHHSSNSAYFSSLPQFIHCGLASPIAIAQCLKRHIKPNLVPIFEAVGNCFCRIENPDGDAFHFLGCHSVVQRRPRKARDSERWIIDSRPAGLLGDGDPHLVRCLSRKIVKAQRRDEADDSVRHSFGGLCQTMMFRKVCHDSQTAESPRGAMKRLHHGPDVTILEH